MKKQTNIIPRHENIKIKRRNSMQCWQNKLDLIQEKINELGSRRKYPERSQRRKKAIKIKEEKNESIRDRGNSDKVWIYFHQSYERTS